MITHPEEMPEDLMLLAVHNHDAALALHDVHIGLPMRSRTFGDASRLELSEARVQPWPDTGQCNGCSWYADRPVELDLIAPLLINRSRTTDAAASDMAVINVVCETAAASASGAANSKAPNVGYAYGRQVIHAHHRFGAVPLGRRAMAMNVFLSSLIGSWMARSCFHPYGWSCFGVAPS